MLMMLSSPIQLVVLVISLSTSVWANIVPTHAQSSLQTSSSGFPDMCDCSGTRYNTDEASKTDAYICRDARLGPVKLPLTFPLLSIASNYNRFNGMLPGEFLQKYWDSKAKRPGWIYPDHGGFQLDINNTAISSPMLLPKGMLVDRFGRESGHYMAAADAPFAQRSLPPDALNGCDEKEQYCAPDGTQRPYAYNLYKVLEPIMVEGGPVAPAFGQFGLGAQFFLGDNVTIKNLVDQNYLVRLDPDKLLLGPGFGREACGRPQINCTCVDLSLL